MPLYRHYKNKLYKLLGTVKHSETLEDLTLYKTLYNNPNGELWVRPQGMFFEDVVIDGKTQPRFASVEIQVEHFAGFPEEQKQKILPLIHKIFIPFDDDKMDRLLSEVKNPHLLIASFDNKPVGFKLGYEQDDNTFYSWLGAVEPEWRGRGVAAELMFKQHQWAREKGYKKVVTKTLNRWRDMLILNLRHDFQIVGNETDSAGDLKIILEKIL